MDDFSASPRLLISSSPDGSNFVLRITIYAVIGCFATAVISRVLARDAHIKQIRHGLLAPVNLPWFVRGSISMFLFLVFLLPAVLVVICWVFGPLLSLFEGWGVLVGIEYMLVGVFDLQPLALTNAQPSTIGGKLMDLLLTTWAMLIITFAVGLAALMQLFAKIGENVPNTAAGFTRFLMIYVPVGMLVICAIAGAVLAFFEEIEFIDGFLYMAGQAAGLGLVNIRPHTLDGVILGGIFNVVEIGIIAGVIGLIATHPIPPKVVDWIEGTVDDTEGEGSSAEIAPENMDLAELHEAVTAQEEAVKMQQEKLAQLQDTMAKKQQELASQPHQAFALGQYKVIIHHTVVTESLSIDSADITELKPGTKVDVVEVKDLPHEHRVRGRIDNPAGWISLRNTQQGYNWVMPIAQTL